MVEIPSDDEADVPAEPSMPLWSLAVVQSVAGTSGGPVVSPRDLAVAQLVAEPSSKVPEGDLEWPCPEHPANAWFVLRDSWDHQL